MSECIACHSNDSELFSFAFDRLQIKPGARYSVFRCRHCGLGWTLPRPEEEDLPEYYPPSYLGDTQKIIDEYESGSLEGTSSWRMEEEKVRLVSKFASGGSILDVGCAEGKFLWALPGEAWEKTGVEFEESVVELVKERIPDLKLFQGPLEKAELDDAAFDVVTFWHVLEHVTDPISTLERVARLLKKGGYLIVSCPNLESFQAHWFRHHWYAFSDVPRHLYHFSPQSLNLMLERSGYSPVDNIFFSKKVNFHCWKHSLRSWWGAKTNSSIPYCLTKPFLHLLPFLEGLTSRYSIMTSVAKREFS